jgi:hypothetical protein
VREKFSKTCVAVSALVVEVSLIFIILKVFFVRYCYSSSSPLHCSWFHDDEKTGVKEEENNTVCDLLKIRKIF